ncbi:MAG: hypothetical protein E7167_04990 [Firmicutes bacterium]|nr:hypothetical protein [Bacillota bacterium]
MKEKSVYVILMNTGTLLSRTIKLITRYEYSHVVLSLDNTYTKLYSFGRKRVHNFLNAGLVTYGIESDFFKKFKNTNCLIYELKVTQKQYSKLSKVLKNFEKNLNLYHYDIKGLLIRYFYTNAKSRENYYVCSQFVATVLQTAEICHFDKPLKLVKPHDFNDLPDIQKIYEGKLLLAR